MKIALVILVILFTKGVPPAHLQHAHQQCLHKYKRQEELISRMVRNKTSALNLEFIL